MADAGDRMTIQINWGLMILEPVKYTLFRLAGGRGRLENEFMTLEGDYADLLAHTPLLGGRVTLA
jgi:hypothetical protein